MKALTLSTLLLYNSYIDLSTQNTNKSRIKAFSLIYTKLTLEQLSASLSSHITLTGTPVRQGLINIVYFTVNSRKQACLLPRFLEDGRRSPGDRGLGGLIQHLCCYWGSSDLSARGKVWEQQCSHSERNR